MNIFNEELATFVNSLDQHDWFCDAEVDALGRFVVYVDKMDIPFIGSTPDKIGGHHVLFHFVASQPASKELPVLPSLVKPEPIIPVKEIIENLPDLSFLISELDKLEKICGSNILQDIFYEVHDGKNAVTNLGGRYPEVKHIVEELYDEYGFDLIYEELDG